MIIPLRQKTPPLAAWVNGEVDPDEAPQERSGVCFGGMKPFGEMIPRLKRNGRRRGFISA